MTKLLTQVKSIWNRLRNAGEGHKAVCYCCLVFLVILAAFVIILYSSHHGAVAYYVFFVLPFFVLLFGILTVFTRVFIAVTIAFYITLIVHMYRNSADDFIGALPFITVYVFLSIVSTISFLKLSQK